MKTPQAIACWCGRGCTGKGISSTDPRILSERDAVAKYLSLHGPMPVFAEGDGESEPVVLYWIESIDDPRIDAKVTTARKARQEQAEADPEAKRRHGEAMAWVTAYTGSWGLILDIRADRRWGTKYMKLSLRQVEVILAARDRDAARAQVAQSDPAQAEARRFLAEVPREEMIRDAARGFTFLLEMAAQGESGRPFSERQLAAIINCRSRRAPRASETSVTSEPVTQIGLYRADDGTVYKVQAARQSGHLYAKKLAVFGPGSASFEFEQGAIRKLRPEQRMTVEDAQAFGHQFGVCAVCGAALTDPVSVERGIGPVCASKV